jgi:hypothetical protein
MKTQVFLINAFLVLAATLVLFGCGTKTGSGATVNLTFDNNTASNYSSDLKGAGIVSFMQNVELQDALLGVTPTIYQMKLVAMYIVEDIDANQNNAGALTRIWTSNKCDSTLTLCGIGPAAGEYIVDYFDFAAGTAAVNATLNSYRRDAAEATVNSGTYRYIRLDFQGATGGNDADAKNLKFGTSSENIVRAQRGSLNVAFASPMVLKDGETFTVDLAYDLENRFYESGTAGSPPAEVSADDKWTCNGTGSGIPCIVETNFSPTVTKQ